MKKITFPPNFDWGSAASGPQTEGSMDKANQSIWDYWYQQEPYRFYQEVGPEITSNTYHQYEEDIAMMKAVGMKSFRTSIQWTRLIKNVETAEVDPTGVAFYRQYFAKLLENGIEPIVNLFHFDMPIDLAMTYGGFESLEVVNMYVKYAEQAFKLFGDQVTTWFTFNEPIAYTRGAYLYDQIFPNEVNSRTFVQVNYHILLAHAKTVQLFKTMKLKGRIGIIVDLLNPIPRSQNELDVYGAEVYDLFFNRIFMDPCVRGEYDEAYLKILDRHNLMFTHTMEDLEIIRTHTVTFVGINYYQPVRLKARETLPNPFSPFMPEWYFDYYEMPNKRMNVSRGWEIYPKAIYDIAMRVKEEYHNIDWFISENGMGVMNEESFKDESGIIQDDYRIDFIKEHLTWLAKAIDEGANCQGYHLWTFIDNWSWTNAYKNRYGLVSLDLATKQRTMKKSGDWLRQVIQANGFEIN